MSAVAIRTSAAGSLILAVALAGCSAAAHKPAASPVRRVHPGSRVALRRSRPPAHAIPRVLVTAETRNRLYVVDLRSGRVTGRMVLAGDPENVVSQSVAVIVSPRAGAVTLADPGSLRSLQVIRGFGSPHIPAISPDGRYAYVTDDLRGTLTTIDLQRRRVVSRISVGIGAHHLSFRPDGRQLWIVLGESARTIVVVDTSNPVRPLVLGRMDPGYPAHDLSFTPDGQRVWVTSAIGTKAGVFSSRNHRLLFRVPVGPPPQHIAFAGSSAYLTSGYGAVIEKVAPATGRVVTRTRAPYGSFELDAGDGYVVTSSLLRGTVAIYDLRLERRRTVQVARATRDLAITLR